jgi:shikimate dehydrogenase
MAENRKSPFACARTATIVSRLLSGPKLQPIAASTQYAAVYGHPVKHSASPAMHNAAIGELGLNWRYLAFDVHPDSLRTALKGAESMRFIGLNLTVPHKLMAVEMMDILDPSAKQWGAVNTVLFEGQCGTAEWKPLRLCDPAQLTATRSHGFNTDANAIARSIEEELGVGIRGAAILVVGAGGAGRTATLKLADAGASELFLVNRTATKAEQVAREVSDRFPATKVQLGYPKSSMNLVLNATSAGLKKDDPLPYDPTQFSFKNCRAAYDMIYRPAETPFLKEAARAGCRTANGLGMLLYQGAKALEIWSGVPAPIEVMRRALKEHIYSGEK